MGVSMYINRKGVVDKKGIKDTLKDFAFDVESILLLAGRDTIELFYDVYEDMIDLRWDIFVYRMHKRGLMTASESKRFGSFVTSILNIVFR